MKKSEAIEQLIKYWNKYPTEERNYHTLCDMCEKLELTQPELFKWTGSRQSVVAVNAEFIKRKIIKIN